MNCSMGPISLDSLPPNQGGKIRRLGPGVADLPDFRKIHVGPVGTIVMRFLDGRPRFVSGSRGGHRGVGLKMVDRDGALGQMIPFWSVLF